MDDWICDKGYEPVKVKGRLTRGCSPVDAKKASVVEIPENCDSYYPITRGYRKVAGSFCHGGVDFSPVMNRCPLSQKLYLLTLSMMFVVVFLALYTCYKFKDILISVVVSVIDPDKYGFGLDESKKEYSPKQSKRGDRRKKQQKYQDYELGLGDLESNEEINSITENFKNRKPHNN